MWILVKSNSRNEKRIALFKELSTTVRDSIHLRLKAYNLQEDDWAHEVKQPRAAYMARLGKSHSSFGIIETATQITEEEAILWQLKLKPV